MKSDFNITILKFFDERNQFIANMSCRLLFLLSVLVLVVLCLINVWFGITFSYAKFLLLILSFVLYGYLLIYLLYFTEVIVR